MPAANMMENRPLPALQVPEPQGAPEGSPVWSSSSTPTLRRRRFKMRRMKNVQEQSLEAGLARDLPGVLAPGKEFLQLPSIEITPSSDEDTPWSNCSTPSASPRRKRFLLRKWLRVRERKECSESRTLALNGFVFLGGATESLITVPGIPSPNLFNYIDFNSLKLEDFHCTKLKM
ncbi:GRAMD1B isoform 16 [Pongo abelii]|uniref:GRAMD1B isoform 16 n=1 Tax=Pongo abelii TaxID=9601 RepID=A0A2J8X0C6_PONAB|nr:GRAMD1B isoform 16 [Pongo abelii]